MSLTIKNNTLIVSSQGAQGRTGLGLPAGGTTDQVIVKNSGTDYDTKFTSYLGQTNPLISRSHRPSVVFTDNTKTLALTDADFYQIGNNTGTQTVLVPVSTDVEFPQDTEIDFFQQGVGSITFAGAPGVAILSASGNLEVTTQYDSAKLKKIGTDTWALTGNLSPYSGTVTRGKVVELDAQNFASLNLTGSLANEWMDLSGANNNVFASAAQRPTYSATSCNGLPGVTGNGTGNIMASLAKVMVDNSNYTLTIVGSGNNFAGNSVIAAFGNAAMQLENNTFTGTRLFQNGQSGAPFSQHITQGQDYIFTIVYRSGVNWVDFYLNGVIVGQSPNGGTYNYTQGLFQLFCFGTGAFGACTIGQLLMYNTDLSPEEVSQNHQVLSGKWNIPVEAYKNVQFDIVLCNGQSNMPGRNGPIDRLGADAANSAVYQLGRYGVDNFYIMQGFETLQYPEFGFNTVVGLALSYAKAYVAGGSLTAGRAVLLLPCAVGGSGFTNNMWNPGDAVYEDMISRALATLSAYPGSKVVSFIWEGGEQDQFDTQAQYSTSFDAMYNNALERIPGSESMTLIVGELLVGGAATGAGVSAALAATPDRLPNAYYAPSTGLPGGSDNIHFTATSSRTLGQRFYQYSTSPGIGVVALEGGAGTTLLEGGVDDVMLEGF